jgi:iron complex outermembrane receptor protein
MSGFLPSRKLAKFVSLLAIGASFGGYTPAWSQAAAARADAGDMVLDEVLVTATRRETKLGDTPISMSVITADQIEHQRIVNFGDVELAVPNFVFTQVTRQETYFSIRGTGVDNDTPGSDAGVSVFIDGVPRTGVHDNNPDLFDLQGLEVLRGPQGTLFGRNTTGGAVIIHTIAPSFQPLFKGQLTYGSDNLIEVNGLATGQMATSTTSFRIARTVPRNPDRCALNYCGHPRKISEWCSGAIICGTGRKLVLDCSRPPLCPRFFRRCSMGPTSRTRHSPLAHRTPS